IPVDGVVERGIAMVDQKMLTGESRPVRKEKGSDVLAGTALVDGKLYVVATAVADATRAGWIIRALDEVPAQDTRAAAYANRVADGLVGPTFALAGLSLLVSGSLRGAASILIVDFATGIRLSAPTTIMATLTRAAADGVLIKSGRALEQLAAVDAILFDKTGTLTLGDPAVSDVRTLNGYSEEEILGLAAAAEIRLRHPAARALVRHTPGARGSWSRPGSHFPPMATSTTCVASRNRSRGSPRTVARSASSRIAIRHDPRPATSSTGCAEAASRRSGLRQGTRR
ncbi:MAG: HAD family hydrolase, partial [Deltaproteobacteria bacterium]